MIPTSGRESVRKIVPNVFCWYGERRGILPEMTFRTFEWNAWDAHHSGLSTLQTKQHREYTV